MCTKRRKLGSGSTNVINSLPDEVLAQIVSYLPTKQAIATSLLSKRWRHLFPLMNQIFACQHHFYLDDSDLFYPEKNGTREREDYVVQQSFRDFVDKLLSDCNTIKKLSLICRDRRITFALIDQWILKALERGLIDLDLRLKKISDRMVMHLPYSKIFTSKKLVKLTLEVEVNLTLIVYPEVFLPMLKSLVLLGVWFKAERLCRVMLPGCPILEELSLLDFNYTHLFHQDEPPLVISHKTLKTLRVHYNDCIEFPRFMTLDTPSLVYIDYSGFPPLQCSKASFLDSLVEAKLDVAMDQEDYISSDIFPLVRNVKTLSLSSASVKMMHFRGWKRLPIFSNLIKLSFESNTKEGWKFLPRLLSKCPKLETFVLKGLHCARKEEVSIDENEVKVLVIYEFRGSGREFRRLKWFLCQMKFLQVVKVKLDADVNKKLKLINHLLDLPNLPECSSKCQIQVL